MAKRIEPQNNSEQKWIPDAFGYNNVEDILDTTATNDDIFIDIS